MQIERDVPIPPKRVAATATIRRLQPGESVLIPPEVSAYVNTMLPRLRRETGRRFECRRQDGGWRVWCVESVA